MADVLAADDTASRERAQAVARGLEAISGGDRDVLLLTLVDGLLPREIAARLSLSPDVVRQRKSRALRRIIAAVSELPRIGRLRPL